METFLFLLSVSLFFIIVILIAIVVRQKIPKRIGPLQTSYNAASLRDQKLKFEVVVNAIEDGVILIDNSDIIQLFNPSACNISGWNYDEAIGINIKAVIKLLDDKNQPIDIKDTPFEKSKLQKATVKSDDSYLQSRSNKYIPINLSVSPLLDEQDNITGQVAVFRNISEEKIEEQRRADFISTASHEMRTPVAAIEGYLSLALNDKVATIDNRARSYLDKAHTSTEHLGQLFQDLLTSAKAEDGRLSSHPEVIEIGEFLQQLTDDLKFSAVKKGLFTEFVVGSSKVINANKEAAGEHVVKPLYYIVADPERLREVITNIFDNAVKYTEQGKISIGITGNNSIVQFYIRDTGAGIPKEDIPHLFQKFYRVDNTATRTIGGTGLGLFISRKIVELYKGRLWVESELGKGSTFFINFPRIDTSKAAELQAQTAKSTTLEPINPLINS